MKSPDALERAQAASGLGEFGQVAAETIPALSTVMLHDPEETVRIQAAIALLKMGPASRLAVAELSLALSDHSEIVRKYALLTIERLGADARAAIPALSVQQQMTKTM